MSRSHPQQWSINKDIERATPDLVQEFRAFPTTQIADSGGPVSVVGPGLVPLGPQDEVCGTAVTLWVKPGDILFVLKAPDLISAGDVLVIDAGGRLDAAVIGDIIGGLVKERGGVGIVVDGAVRDAADLRAVGITTFARGTHPATGSKDGPGALNVAIQCAGATVQPGDIVRADSSGIVIIPRESAQQVLELTREVEAREVGWRAALAQGQSFGEALGVDALIASLSTSPDETPLP